MRKVLSYILLSLFFCGITFFGVIGCAVPNAEGGAKNSPIVTAESGAVNMPVIMYHSILNSVKGKYIVSEKQLEDDLIAFKNAGYSTVFPSEVIAYVEGRGSLPNKPIMVTFDDGNYNNLYYGLPILKRNGAKALISVIGVHSEKCSHGDNSHANYSNLTWEQVATLANSGCFEIGNHTYDLHKYSPRFGVGRMQGESSSQYNKVIAEDLMRLQDKLQDTIGYAPNVFTYPFGNFDPSSYSTFTQLGFKMLLTCSEGTNTMLVGNSKCLNYIFRFNRFGAYSTKDIMDIISVSK